MSATKRLALLVGALLAVGCSSVPDHQPVRPTTSPSAVPIFGLTSITLEQIEPWHEVPLPPPNLIEVGTQAFKLTIGIGGGAARADIVPGLQVTGAQVESLGFDVYQLGSYLQLTFSAGAPGEEIAVRIPGVAQLRLHRVEGPLVEVLVGTGSSGHGGNWASVSALSNAFQYQDNWQIKIRFTRPMDRPSVEAALRRASGDREGLSFTWSDDSHVALAFGGNPPPRVDLHHLRTARDHDGYRPVGMLPAIWFVPEPPAVEWRSEGGPAQPGPRLMPGITRAMLAPDGSMVLLWAQSPGQGAGNWTDRLWVVDLPRGGWRSVPIAAGEAAWLPDGLLAVEVSGKILTWSPQNAAVVELAPESPSPDWHTQRYTPEGDLLAGTAPDSRTVVVLRHPTTK